MAEKRILIVHPYDITTAFLKGIVTHLQSEFSEDVHYISINPNNPAHTQCLERINTHPSGGLIIFLGHGRSDKLYGSKGDDSDALVSYDAIVEYPEKYYSNENFISEENVGVFTGKKVYCLACNSNDKIADYAIEKGALTFLGFGDIPTSTEELVAFGINYSTVEIISIMNTELNNIIKISLGIGIAKDWTFEQLQNLIDFIINQRISDILINKKELSDRYVIADYLYFLKKSIRIKGDKKQKLIA